MRNIFDGNHILFVWFLSLLIALWSRTVQIHGEVLITTDETTATTNSVSTMNCNSLQDDGKIVCEIVLDRNELQSTHNNNNYWVLDNCNDKNDEDSYCYKVHVTQTLKSNKEFQSSSSSTEDTTKTRANHNQNFKGITIGTRSYEPPLSQYGRLVQRALQDIIVYYNTKDMEVKNHQRTLDLADRYVILGLAHLGQETNEDFTIDEIARSLPIDLSGTDTEGTINAFLEAMALYEDALSSISDDMEHDDVSIHLASIAMLVAEEYMQAAATFDPIEQPGTTVDALHYFQKAESIFEKLLTEGSSRLDATTYDEIELSWATTKMNLGRIRLTSFEQTSTLSMMMNELQSYGMGDFFSTTAGSHGSNYMNDIKQAQQYFEESIKIYRRAIDRTNDHEEQITGYTILLAEALSSAGTAFNLLGESEKGIQFIEEAIENYRRVSLKEYQGLLADLLFTISDLYLQLGRYDETNDRYHQAMEFFQSNPPNFAVPEMLDSIPDVMESLNVYETTLQEYYKTTFDGREVPAGEIPIPDDYRAEGESWYEADEIYEADLHSSIGALKLSLNKNSEALEHLKRALELYSNNIDEDSEEARVLADIQINMASAYVQIAEYQESEEVHREAVEIYRRIVPAGQNPLVDETLMEELKATVASQQTANMGSSKGKGDDNGAEDNKKSDDNDVVHEDLIDVDEYKAEGQNKTRILADEL